MSGVQRLALPAELDGLELIASVSGGKDSTALMLALREAGLPFRAVFADTGWEASETYDYLDLLRERLGIAIDVVGVEGGMVEKIRRRAGFSARKQRWCTRELKLEPLRAYLDRVEAESGSETVCVVGIRAAESEARSKMAALEDEPPGPRSWGGWVWRPLLAWPVDEVLAIHHRHDIPVNPLYQRGHDRVGCYPCIFARKEEIRLIADHAPERIDQIEELERETTALRAARNALVPETTCGRCGGDGSVPAWTPDDTGLEEEPPEGTCPECGGSGRSKKLRYSHAIGTFFQTRDRGGPPMGIREIVTWARTDRGGRQLPLLAEPPRGGCMRWGLCDPPSGEGDR